MSNRRTPKITRAARAARHEGSIRTYKLPGYRVGVTQPTLADRRAQRRKKKKASK